MIDRNAQIRMVGPSSGMVMWRWVCHHDAPSICEASLELFRYALQSGEEQDDREAEVLPAQHDEEGPEHDVLVGQPELAQAAEAQRLDHAVEGAVGLQQQLPGEPGDHLAEHEGHEDQDAEHRPPAHAPVEQQRDADRDRPLDREREADDAEVVPDRGLEDGVGERADVVVESDEPVERAQPVPVEEAVDRGEPDRQQHERHVHEQGRRDERHDQQAPASASNASAGREPGPRRSPRARPSVVADMC